MTGEKPPLVVIGQSKQPRFTNNHTKLPTVYKSNKKAWMTGSLFKEWLQVLGQPIDKEDCHGSG